MCLAILDLRLPLDDPDRYVANGLVGADHVLHWKRLRLGDRGFGIDGDAVECVDIVFA